MSDFFTRMGEFGARLLAGGTLEIVLLIILVVVAVVLLLAAVWILWKLLVLLGKGLLAGYRIGDGVVRKKSADRRAARLAAPPSVATSWASASRISLPKAIREARRTAGPDALCLVVVAGDGVSDLCRGLGLTPPPVADIGIAAARDTILIDATRADTRKLRVLALALPWQRAVDGMVSVIGANGVPEETLARASAFARAAGLRATLHFAFAGPDSSAVWRVVDFSNRSGNDVCAQLAQDAARFWLAGGPRDGLRELTGPRLRELAATLDRALATAPTSTVDIASVNLGGAGLRAAVAQTAARTRPATAPGPATWFGVGGAAVAIFLAVLTMVAGVEDSADLRTTVSMATREASTPWLTRDVEALPGGARVRRVAGISARLAEFSDFSALSPFKSLVPNHGAPARLGGELLTTYVLRPLGAALDRRTRHNLLPSAVPGAWLDNAQQADEWLAAWEGLADDPREVDLRRLLADAFGGPESAWPEGLDIALARTDVQPPPSSEGLDVDALAALARENFIVTMQRWAESVYANGPVAVAARRAVDRSARWETQHRALTELRTALQDPGQIWLTAAEDRPDYGFELRVLGRALGLAVVGETAALEAKAAVSRIRIDARTAAEHFIVPEVGPLMVRSSTGAQGGGGGPSLALTPEARGWLAFLDRVASAGFADLPKPGARAVVGPVTVDPTAVAAVTDKLRTFDRFGADLPTDLPPAVAQDLLLEVASELVIGVAAGVEAALRPAVAGGTPADANRLLRTSTALDGLDEIETWLRGRRAAPEADRVLAARSRVAENVLAVGEQILVGEDPLGLHLDPSADANALVRRFDRGVVRLRRLYDQFGAPYADVGVLGGRAPAFRWREIGDDIDGYERGDAGSALSGLEGMARAFAEDAGAACEAPMAGHAGARDDYVADALARFRDQVEDACTQIAAKRVRDAYAELADYFSRNVAWMWPYSRDPNAPELPASTFGDFVARLHAARPVIEQFDEPLARLFRQHAGFWSLDGDGAAAVLRFRAQWRARPGEEQFAEHVIEFAFEGVESDESDLHSWRYGAPAVLRIRLAKDSPYRFVSPADPAGLELVVGGRGNGSILRILEGLTGGHFVVAAELVDDGGTRVSMRATARISNADGAPLSVPRFDTHPGAYDALRADRN